VSCASGASGARPDSASSSRAGSAPSARGLRAGHARRAARAGLRDHAFFHGQLRAGGIPGTAMPLVDAAPIGTQQAARHVGRLGRFQAGDRLELRTQRAVGEVFQEGSGRGGVQAGAGQDPAQVLDHIRAGPRAPFLLSQRYRLLRRACLLQLGQNCALGAAWLRVCAAACAMPHRRRD
jgi:hypothetical protein